MGLLSSVSLVLSLFLLLSLWLTLFSYDGNETLEVNLSREEAFKKELFTHYLEAEACFKKGEISQPKWEEIRKKSINEYKKNIF